MTVRRLAGFLLILAGCANGAPDGTSSSPLHSEVPVTWMQEEAGEPAPDGTGINTAPDGTGINTAPDGTGINTAPDGTGINTAPDGTGKVLDPKRVETGATVAGTTAPTEASASSQPAGSGARSVSATFGTVLPPAAGLPESDRQRSPAKLRLPSIGVESAAVVGVGVEPDGAMEIPPASQVGWYRFGPLPGEDGSTVLAAHIAADGTDGVFRHLDRLRTGDTVELVDTDGVPRSYEIVGLGQYAKDELPFDELFARTGPSRLALITCGGDFHPELGAYDSNVVAFAIPTS